VAGQTVTIRPYQIIVWVSLTVRDVIDDPLRFPAVLDTAHNHNFSIREEQLEWAGLQEAMLEKVGEIRVNRQEVRLRKGYVWIYRNRPGSAELLPKPYRLDLPQGFAVHPSESQGPRLPLLGLRGIVTNGLKLGVDGQKLAVSLRM
jgi:hypothetical protein